MKKISINDFREQLSYVPFVAFMVVLFESLGDAGVYLVTFNVLGSALLIVKILFVGIFALFFSYLFSKATGTKPVQYTFKQLYLCFIYFIAAILSLLWLVINRQDYFHVILSLLGLIYSIPMLVVHYLKAGKRRK